MRNRQAFVCHAIDKDKFQYTFWEPGEGETKESQGAYETRIMADFRHYFPDTSTIVNLKQLLRLVGSSKKVAEWYKTWNSEKAADNLAPDWIPNTVEDQERWLAAVRSAEGLKTREIGWTNRVKEKADALKEVVKTVDSERKAYVNTLDPLVIIDRVSVNELPFTDQQTLAVIDGDDDRKATGKRLLKAYKIKLYGDVKGSNFVNPFG